MIMDTTIAVIGGCCVGKSCIVHRRVYDKFEFLPATIGFKLYFEKIDGKSVCLQDTEDWIFRNLTSGYSRFVLKHSHGVMLVIDIANQNYPIVPERILEELKRFNLVVLLVGNKCDLPRAMPYEEIEMFANHHGLRYIEVSAKTGHNINQAFQMLINMVKLKHHKATVLMRSISNATREHRTIKVRFLKILLTGSAAAGKTSFSHLLLNKRFREYHHSTNVVHASHAVSVTKAVIQSSPNDVEWVQLGFDTEVGYLQSLLSALSVAPPEQKSTQFSLDPEKSAPSSIGALQMKRPQGFLKRLFSSLTNFNNSIHHLHDTTEKTMHHLSTFHSILQSCLHSPFTSFSLLNYYPDEILNIITVLDTGGQPDYIHLLPVINLSPTINFVVHNLSNDLDDQVMVQHSQDDKPTFTPYPMSYSNFDMIRLLVSTANDSIERDSSCVLSTAEPGIDKSYLCMIGTHKDTVPSDVVTATSDKLTAMVNSMKNCGTSVWHHEDGSVLFSVDNTTAGTSNEDPSAKLIRNRIEELAAQKSVYELPVTWMLLNLEIQQVCSKKQKTYISFDECLSLARTSNLISDSEEVKNVFRYYHLLGVMLYFEEVPGLCDYIITDHQWLFDKLSQVVCLTFQDICNDRSTAQRLKYQGLFSKSLLQHMQWEGDIKQEYFLSLLAHMKVIATLFTEEHKIEYFIPYVLPTYTEHQKDKLICQYGDLKGEPYLIRFKSGLLPRGLFCSLVVQLLQPPTDWYPHFSQEGTQHTFQNLITLNLPNAYSLSLFDKVSCLEIQVRHKDKDFYSPVHSKILKRVEDSLKLSCEHLKFKCTRLEHGFWCSCNSKTGSHIAVLPDSSSPLQFASCSLNSTKPLQLKPSHLLWLTDKVRLTDSGQVHKPETQDLPNPTLYTDCDNLQIPRTVSSLSQSINNAKLLREIVVPRVAAYWDEVSDYLEYEPEYQHLIRKKCRNDPWECCLELLKDWFSSSRGVSPKSWAKLIDILREIPDHASTAEKIAKELTNVGVDGVQPSENTTV